MCRLTRTSRVGRFLIAWLPLLACYLTSGGTIAWGYEEERYTAVFADGKRVSDGEVREWHDERAKPKIAGRQLFDGKNPIISLVDNTLEASTEDGPRIEFHGGDSLPGRVISLERRPEGEFDYPIDQLLVEPALAWDHPEQGQNVRRLRVTLPWLRKIVWEPRGSANYQPSTAFLVDGRQISFRSLRWSVGAIRLLREEGTLEIPFSQLAELHFPAVSPWESYAGQLAVIDPECASQIVRIETNHGLRLTTSQDRYRAAHRHNAGDPNQWFRIVQPAWSLDSLWLRHRTIRLETFHEPWKLPLSRVEPIKVTHSAALGGGWPWQINRNVQGGPLAADGRTFAWGFGVHGGTRLEFELPTIAREFRTSFGLDDCIGAGGCVAGMVSLVDKEERLVYRSPTLVGSSQVVDSNVIPLTSIGKRTRLVLEIDPLYGDRPSGADPLDIRDTADWLEPIIVLDETELRGQVRERATRQLPGLAGWTVVNSDPSPFEVTNVWDATLGHRAAFRHEIIPRQQLLTVRQTVEVTPDRQWLALGISRYEQDRRPGRISVQVDGQPAGVLEAPIRRSGYEPDPLLISLKPYIGREVAIEMFFLPDGPRAKLEWRATQFAPEPPGLLKVFDEEADFASKLIGGAGKAEYVIGDHFSGQACIKIVAPGITAPQLAGFVAKIRENPGVGEYRFIRFACRKVDGKTMSIELARDGNLGPDRRRRGLAHRYDFGLRQDKDGRSVQLEKKPGEDWIVHTRDLYVDFGSFDLTGFSFQTLDGDAFYIDHIYLARQPHYFERIEFPASPVPPPGGKK